MPHSVPVLRKEVPLNNDDVVKIFKLLKTAYKESGLVSNDEALCGGDKEKQNGFFTPVIVLYEAVTDKNAGSHKITLREYKYELDDPAYQLQTSYSNYLNFIFKDYVTPENAAKQDKKNIDVGIIDDPYVLVKEILTRLFTSAISINKNDSSLTKEAKNIISCLEKFVEKINKTDLMHKKSLFSSILPSCSEPSDIHLAFAKPHKEWIHFLKQMQEIIENMHKHTASITSFLEALKKVKSTIALQLVAYISKGDISEEKLQPEWISKTLFECEMAVLKQERKELNFEDYQIVRNNFNSTAINSHQRSVINFNETNSSVKNLYCLLARTNFLLTALGHIDTLLSTTGWMLIITNVLSLEGLSALMKDYRQGVLSTLDLECKSPHFNKKQNIKKAY